MAGMSRASALEFSFFFSIPTMAAATGLRLLKSLMGKGENPIGVAQIDLASVGGAGDWFCGFLSGRLCFGGVVHGLGAETWVCAVRDIPDSGGSFGADVCRKLWLAHQFSLET